MGALTETMTRLREEISGWRQARVNSRAVRMHATAERRNRVSALCAGFARDRAGAQRAWFGRTPSVPQLAARSTGAPFEAGPKPHFKGSKKH